MPDRKISGVCGGGHDCAGPGGVGTGTRGRSPVNGRGGGLSERGERLPVKKDEREIGRASCRERVLFEV